jgi:hypothetical protein
MTRAKSKSKKSPRKISRKVSLTLSPKQYGAPNKAIAKIYDTLDKNIRGVRKGDYIQIDVKRRVWDAENNRQVYKVKRVTVKKGKAKISRKRLSALSQSIATNLFASEYLEDESTFAESWLDSRYADDIMTPAEYKRTRQAFLTPAKVKTNKTGRYVDKRGRFIKGVPKFDKNIDKWRDGHGRFISV